MGLASSLANLCIYLCTRLVTFGLGVCNGIYTIGELFTTYAINCAATFVTTLVPLLSVAGGGMGKCN